MLGLQKKRVGWRFCSSIHSRMAPEHGAQQAWRRMRSAPLGIWRADIAFFISSSVKEYDYGQQATTGGAKVGNCPDTQGATIPAPPVEGAQGWHGLERLTAIKNLYIYNIYSQLTGKRVNLHRV